MMSFDMRCAAILLVLFSIPACAQSPYDKDYWRRSVERIGLSINKPLTVFNPSPPAFVSVYYDIGGTTIRYATPSMPPLVIRTYPGNFGSINVQYGSQISQPLGSFTSRMVSAGIVRPTLLLPPIE